MSCDQNLILRTLDTIAVERDNFDHSFDLVQQIVGEFGEDHLAERLYGLIPHERPWQDIADMFGFLVWCTSDNGGELMETMDAWLQSADDERKVLIALNIDIYPFRDQAEMKRVLTSVALRWPNAAARCAELIRTRGAES